MARWPAHSGPDPLAQSVAAAAGTLASLTKGPRLCQVVARARGCRVLSILGDRLAEGLAILRQWLNLG